jgi:hypothetical protein
VTPVHNTSNQTPVISVDGVSEAEPITVPHTITILHRGNKILEGLERIVSHEHHFSALQGKLMKDNEWNIHQFQSVAWDDFYKALRSIPRSHRISIAKLSHHQ